MVSCFSSGLALFFLNIGKYIFKRTIKSQILKSTKLDILIIIIINLIIDKTLKTTKTTFIDILSEIQLLICNFIFTSFDLIGSGHILKQLVLNV